MEDSSLFILTRNRSYFKAMIPIVIMKGKVIENEGGSIIKIKFMPALYTCLILLSMAFMFGYGFWNNLVSIESKDFVELIVSFLIMLLILFSLTSWELSKTKDAIMRLIKLVEKS